ncbi:flippase-like domain-containing protein [bacterium]|nr:flippase-like domain-containing protein [bacterium]
MKKHIILALKVGVSAALLYYLITRIDLEGFITAGREFPLWTMLPLTLVFIATIFIGSLRWKVFLGSHGIRQSVMKGVQLYMIGYFFNNFLPSGVGGDVVRGYCAGKECKRIPVVYASIAAERLSGLLGTLAISLLFLPIVRPPAPLPVLVLGLNVLFWVGTIVFIFLNLEDFLRKVLNKLPFGIGAKIGDFVEAVRFFRKDTKALIQGFLLSIIYQGSLITFVFLIAIIAGVEKIPCTAYYVFVPLIWIIALIPISLNALGVREASFSYFFSLWGASEAQGLLVSLLFFGTSVICGIIGGIIWAVSGNRAKSQDIQDGPINKSK